MTKWEYKLETFDSCWDGDHLTWLNLYGKLGWELVQETVDTQYAPDYKIFCIFKRQIEK